MNDLIEAPNYAPAVLAGGALQQVRSPYATSMAVQRPRQQRDIQRRLEDEAALAGEDFYYGWGAGRDRIEGPSVKLAQAAARCYGNCAINVEPVQDMVDAWIFTASFIDLETGFTMSRQFRQSKQWKVAGKHDAERKDDIRFQIGQSKAIRNVILNALPHSLINQAMDKAKEGVRGRITEYVNKNGIAAAIDATLKALLKAGVSEERVLAKVEVANKQALTVDNLVILRADLHAITTGQEYPDVLFPQVQQSSRTAETRERLVPPSEAMTHAQEVTPPPAKPKKATKAQLRNIATLVGKLELTHEQGVEILEKYGAKVPEELSDADADGVIISLNEMAYEREERRAIESES